MDSSTGRAYLAGALSGLALWATYTFYKLTITKPPLPATAIQNSSQSRSQKGGLDLDDEILAEQFTRNIQFFGKIGQQQVADSYVVVVGLGGVGSHAAHLLLRSGVGKLKLVDFDQVSLSSLNRHAVATRNDVGLPKAIVLAQHFNEMLPEADVEPMVAMYTKEAEESILGGPRKPDFVLDAIDDIDTKVELLAACHRRGIPRLCVGGAGAKMDPTRLRFVDLKEAMLDHLTVKIRTRLRRYHNILAGIPVLLSTEKARAALVFTPEQAAAENLLDFQTIPGFRMCAIPVLGTMPAQFGMAAAGYILCKLAGKPFVSEPVFRITRQQYSILLDYLHEDEEAQYGHCNEIGVDLEEVEYIVSNMWRGVSAHWLGVGDIKLDKALHRRTAGLRLARFDPSQPAVPSNLVLMAPEEVEVLREQGVEQWKVSYPYTAAWVDSIFKQIDEVYGKT